MYTGNAQAGKYPRDTMVEGGRAEYGLEMLQDTLADVLARNLLRVRTKILRLTQEQMEERAGVSQSTLSAWERGDNLGQLRKIDAALRQAGADPIELLRVLDAPGMTPEQREVLELWEQCADDGVRRAILDLLRATVAAQRPPSATGIE